MDSKTPGGLKNLPTNVKHTQAIRQSYIVKSTSTQIAYNKSLAAHGILCVQFGCFRPGDNYSFEGNMNFWIDPASKFEPVRAHR